MGDIQVRFNKVSKRTRSGAPGSVRLAGWKDSREKKAISMRKRAKQRKAIKKRLMPCHACHELYIGLTHLIGKHHNEAAGQRDINNRFWSLYSRYTARQDTGI